MKNEIIYEKEPLKLAEDYNAIKSVLTKYLEKNNFCNFLGTKESWDDDKQKIYMLDDKERSLHYRTEQILPQKSKKRIPVMLLFSNPHPASVSCGLFLSEPGSRRFWTRIFDCKTIFPEEGNPDYLINYDAKKLEQSGEIKKLRNFMVLGKYESEFLLYFYCYWGLPTRDAPGLKSIFSNHTALWKKMCGESQNEFEQTLKEFEIKNVIVFADPPFKRITNIGALNKYKYKTWLEGVKEHLNNPDNTLRTLLQKIQIQWTLKDDDDVKVYRSLITRIDKDLKIRDTDKYYFTELLNLIFQNILSESGQNKKKNKIP